MIDLESVRALLKAIEDVQEKASEIKWSKDDVVRCADEECGESLTVPEAIEGLEDVVKWRLRSLEERLAPKG